MGSNISITITRQDVISRCRMLAAYEGRDRYTDSGQSLYSDVSIADQDVPLIDDFLSRSLLDARQKIDDMIKTIAEDASGNETWTLRSIQKRYDTKGATSLSKHIAEALSASVMTAWLSYRGINERAAFYGTLYENEMKLVSDNIHTKSAPARPQ